ncbi:MAG: hypothetical protein MUP98_15765 [Candidatus Aminicenantes bacterium]|nr:hypothetical protein [Candidatus Aminicenantes bacterium]
MKKMILSQKMNHFFKALVFIFCVFLMNCRQPQKSEYSQSQYSIEEARRVFQIIGQLEQKLLKNSQKNQDSVIVTESELNSYFAYRIETEKEEIMKQLHLKILKNNKIEGKIQIDLRGQKIPDFLRPEMKIYFSGKIEVKNGKGRILMKKLFLEDQPIQPQVLDAILFIASKLQNYEPTSLYDWYELPFGINNITTKNQQAVFFY